MTNQKQPYGQFSMGSGAILKNPDSVLLHVATPEIIEAYVHTIRRDLDKTGITLNQLKKMHVMDVGTGRQALAFHQLGAKKIDHYDQSIEFVAGLKLFIAQQGLEAQISTQRADLVDDRLPEDTYDLIYLHGIVQHFGHVGQGLKNCIRAMKVRGYMWLYFYRSGTYPMFYFSLMRDVLKARFKERFFEPDFMKLCF